MRRRLCDAEVGPAVSATAELYQTVASRQKTRTQTTSNYPQIGDMDKTIAAYEKMLSSNDCSLSWESQQRWLEARYTLSTDYAAGGDKQKARGTLEKLLDLWKDAGPNLPLLKQAKAEYAKLQ